MERILIIDDDTALCELLLERLHDDDFVTEAVHDGVRGLERARSGEHEEPRLLFLRQWKLYVLPGFRHRTSTEEDSRLKGSRLRKKERTDDRPVTRQHVDTGGGELL